MPLGPFSKRDPIRVEPFFGFRNADRLFVTARAIKARDPVFEKRSFWRDVATMARQYVSHEVPGLSVELEFALPDGRIVTQSAQTCDEGYARFVVELSPEASRPEQTRWEDGVIRWMTAEGEFRETPAHILTPGIDSRIGVISDIDDTILETGITGSFRKIARNWKRVFRQMPSDRILAPGAPSFFNAIGGGQSEAGEAAGPAGSKANTRPVFYVSSSPWNLFSYLVTFKRERGLPLGPVMLRDWGLNRRTLGKESHGSHKLNSIAHILATFPNLQFALIGDDTQKDLAAFGQIVTEFPGRIAAVFIRSISGEPLSEEELRAIDQIEHAKVPFWTGSDYREAKAFLRGAGLDLEAEVKTLVQTAAGDEFRPG